MAPREGVTVYFRRHVYAGDVVSAECLVWLFFTIYVVSIQLLLVLRCLYVIPVATALSLVLERHFGKIARRCLPNTHANASMPLHAHDALITSQEGGNNRHFNCRMPARFCTFTRDTWFTPHEDVKTFKNQCYSVSY